MGSDFVLRIKRAETPFYAALNRFARRVRSFDVPVPRPLLPLSRAVYHLHWGIWEVVRRAIANLYVVPVFRGRCASSGRRLSIWLMPHVIGHTRIQVGDDVTIHGKVGIQSGRVFDEPTLRIGNHVVIGHAVRFSVNREIVIEDHVHIAGGCVIADNDGHPRDPLLRLQGLPPAPEEVKPVRICRNAWLGDGVTVRKGVTVGENAIVGVNSVVLTDVPANCIAVGNPARVVGFAGGAPQGNG